MPGIGLLDPERNIPSGAGLSTLLRLLAAYAQSQQNRMRTIQSTPGGWKQLGMGDMPFAVGAMPSFPGRAVPFPVGGIRAKLLGLDNYMGDPLTNLFGGTQPTGPLPAIPAFAQKFPPLPRFDPQKLLAIREGATREYSKDMFIPGARFARTPEALRLSEIPKPLHPLLLEEVRQFEQRLLEAVTRESRDPRNLSNLLRALTGQ